MYGSPKRSALLSGTLHAAAISLVLFLTGGQNPPIARLATVLVDSHDIGR